MSEMVFGGFLPFSAIDYPEHLSSVFFTQGCNCRCPYCHNPELIPFKNENFMSLDEAFKILEARKKLIDSVAITGGEPTLQNDLADFMSDLKQKGFQVKLDTNGTNPVKIEEIARKRIVDYVSMDVKSSPEKYDAATGVKFNFEGIAEIVKILDSEHIAYELRTTAVPGLVEIGDITWIGSVLGGDRRYVIQNFIPDKTFSEDYKKIKPHKREVIEEMVQTAKKYFSKVSARGFI
ncbi:anaerobic ribonucleoside-triphosphate reductase activating protein [candidate division WOR-3 bacterium]|nr:anaerobic ribonucleoside-triphosphate reductase activating protein [candidate division WOR-3 bacterium]